jgi:hypothetical protein
LELTTIFDALEARLLQNYAVLPVIAVVISSAAVAKHEIERITLVPEKESNGR